MSLLLTRMQNMRSDSRLDKWETRPSRYGALDLFLQHTASPTGIITPELAEKAKVSIGRVLEVPVIDYDQGVTIGNTRTLTIADSENTSRMFAITFATLAWGFTIVPALFANNEISMQRDFETKFMKYLYALGTDLDGRAVAALEAAKTQVFNNSLVYTVAGNTVNATLAQNQRILGDLNVMMAANDFFGDLDVVANAGIESLVKLLSEKSIYNSENKTIQYGDKNWHFSNHIADALDTLGTGFAVNGDSVGILTRFEREAVLGTKAATGHEWGIENLPMFNMPVGTYYYDSVVDASAIAGAASADMTRVRKQHYGFSVDVAFVTAYNSDPADLASPIMKFDIATA